MLVRCHRHDLTFDADVHAECPQCEMEPEMLDRNSKKFERKANALARSYVQIDQCKKCGNPVVHGYCCGLCGDSNPSSTREEDEAFDREYGK